MLEGARGKIAAGVGTAARNLVFTSGATEAANLAVTRICARGAIPTLSICCCFPPASILRP